MQVPTTATPLDSGDHALTVGVNSFGAGGANAHIVLQSVDPQSADRNTNALADGDSEPVLYVLSAEHRDSLRTLAERHADFLRSTDLPLRDVAYSAFTRRSRYRQMMAVVGESSEEIVDRLSRFAAGQVDPETLAVNSTLKESPRLAFVFSGQGGQWVGMGRQLIEREAVFRDSMHQIDALFQTHAGWSLLEELGKPEPESRIHDTVVVQPAVMAIQISLVRLYSHYGIRPAAVCRAFDW